MYRSVVVTVVGIVAAWKSGTNFISSDKEGILRPVPAVTSNLLHDPSPLRGIASEADITAFLSDSGPCVNGYRQSPPWWLVDLGVETTVTGVTVKNTGDCCDPWLGNFTIHVGNRLSSDKKVFGDQTCLTHNGTVPGNTTVTRQCELPVTGRYVSLTSKCVDLFGSILTCEFNVNTDTTTPGSRYNTAVFKSEDKAQSSAEEDLELECARMCMREESCVTFDISIPENCTLYKKAHGNYSLHRLRK